MELEERTRAGQAAYTPFTLKWVYDLVVLGVSNRFLWRCPTARQLAWYDANVSANHLDIGVGTGWFLAHCRFPTERPRLALMDLNQHCLDFGAARAVRHRPETYRADVLKPIDPDIPPFDSVGMNYLLHCLPGTMDEKAVVFDHVKPLMNPGAVLFGATILQGSAPRNAAAQRLMDAYNAKGIFSNHHDTLEDLEAALKTRFAESEVRMEGCVALFRARTPSA